jgi:hypothetical protein
VRLWVYGSARRMWRLVRGVFDDVGTFLRSRSGVTARLVRYPRRRSLPWRRSWLDLGRGGGVGDVLMCTPALRELKLKNPATYVRFYTNYPTLVRGLPYIDEVLAFDRHPEGILILQYEDALPPQTHIARIIGDNLGLSIRDVRPDCVIDRGAVKRFRESWGILPRPHIVVQRRASRWTPNKDWPEEYWVELVNNLSRRTGVIEIGNEISKRKVSLKNYIDLRDRTSLEELVAVIAAADVFVGPISGPVHIAAAADVPAVVIIGGYEHPKNTSYMEHVNLYTALSCAPCWLRKPCPYKLKCLKVIRPSTVESAVWAAWAKRTNASGYDDIDVEPNRNFRGCVKSEQA